MTTTVTAAASTTASTCPCGTGGSVHSLTSWWARAYADDLAVYHGDRLHGRIPYSSPYGELQLAELEDGVELEKCFDSLEAVIHALSQCVVEIEEGAWECALLRSPRSPGPEGPVFELGYSSHTFGDDLIELLVEE